ILFDKIWKEGDTIKQEHLANTLKILQKNYGRDFYDGEIAQKMVEFLQENGGIISLEDLKNYKPVWRRPVDFKFKDFKIYTMGPPSSGGIVLGQILKTLEDYPIQNFEHNSTEYVQLITEISRRAYADRAHYLGDPDFVDLPIDTLLDKDYLRERMRLYSPVEATSSADITHGN